MSDKNCGTGTSSGSGKKTSQRQQQSFQKKQAVIVKKASKLFIKKGYAQTSMRDISKATGINLGNLYYYINSKEEILCLAFNTYHAAMNEALEQKGILDIADPVEQLKAVLRQALENTYDFKDDILMMYRETRVLPRKIMKATLEKEGEAIKLFEDIIIRGNQSGVFRVHDPFFAANMIVLQLSLYSLRRWNLGDYTREEYLDLAEETILKSIIPETV